MLKYRGCHVPCRPGCQACTRSDQVIGRRAPVPVAQLPCSMWMVCTSMLGSSAQRRATSGNKNMKNNRILKLYQRRPQTLCAFAAFAFAFAFGFAFCLCCCLCCCLSVCICRCFCCCLCGCFAFVAFAFGFAFAFAFALALALAFVLLVCLLTKRRKSDDVTKQACP